MHGRSACRSRGSNSSGARRRATRSFASGPPDGRGPAICGRSGRGAQPIDSLGQVHRGGEVAQLHQRECDALHRVGPRVELLEHAFPAYVGRQERTDRRGAEERGERTGDAGVGGAEREGGGLVAGEVDAAVTALPGINAAKALRRAEAKGSSSNTFSGKGATESVNNFSGTITAVVTAVLPNGHLLIAGEKQIGVNANVDVLRFSGQVDPRNIQAGNSVPSAQIANVRLAQRSVGQQGEAQSMAWLSRFFLNVLPI